MRIRKKDLIEIVKQLQDVNEHIDKAGKLIEGLDLAECQELAVKLGNYIEEHYSSACYDDFVKKDASKATQEAVEEAPDTFSESSEAAEDPLTAPIIHNLEEYCELIYQMSLQENSNSAALHKLSKKIRKALNSTSNSINYDLPADRKQIVFLPYKASMWDSLESIWFAARDDKDVDAYVIPIPYFDRNPDGSVAQWYYEGNDYPDYVPITDWQKYSIPDEEPDVIFIHNPYDDCNYVTSVHPSFYSSELKKYTDCLVYVPYFVLSGINIESSFTNVPGCYFADYSICQNESEKYFYVDNLSASVLDGNFDNRILPLGSPKLDKAQNLDATKVFIPNQWAQKIKRKNASLIVFYNSSVGALLRQDGAEYLKKFSDIIKKCVESDILVLWRSHPLMEATLKSMRIDYYEMYMDIKNNFINEEWGILDDLPDMYTSIYLSNVYLGDLSSVVRVYDATKKPIYISEENTENMWYMNDDNREFGSIKEDRLIQASLERIFISWESGFSEIINGSGKRIYERIMLKEKEV